MIPASITKARTSLLLDFEFFGQLALRLDVRMDASQPTEASTDGRAIYFHPEKAAALSEPELVWLWAHEVMHCAKGDLWRGKGKDPERWNIAADYKVNQILDETMRASTAAARRMKAMSGICRDPQYDRLSAEEVYHQLPDNPQGRQPGAFTRAAPQAGGDEDGENGEGQGDDAGGNTLAQGDEALEAEWREAVATAATTTRMRDRGHLPAGIAAAIEELMNPAVSWRELLRQFAARVTRDDYTWKRPNRRFAHAGVMLPSLRTEGLGTIAVVRDTSGSITPELNRAFLTELQEILDTCHPEVIHVLDCDARVHQHLEFRTGDDLRGTAYRGGGGTDFVPAFDYLERHHIEADAVIYLTDLYGRFPDGPPAAPVLWLNYGMPRNKAPFGETVDVPPPGNP